MYFSESGFGLTESGQQAHLYTLSDGEIEISLSDYGATVVSLKVPDARGTFTDIAAGYDSVSGYETGSCYFGAVIGRVANRIEHAAFTLHDQVFHLDSNDGNNCLHGGFSGYDKRLWTLVQTPGPSDCACTFRLYSPDGDQGFPGNLEILVTFRLCGNRSLEIHYRAESDQDTLCNLTNHSYFNLNGHNSGLITAHKMQIFSDAYTPVQGPDCIPDGRITAVAGTPFDFREAKLIGQDMHLPDPQLLYGNGYDHNYVISRNCGPLRPVADTQGDLSGIRMETFSTLPGVQFYTGNSIPQHSGKGGALYAPRCAFCLETQYFPDSINRPDFEPCILKADTPQESASIYRFSTIK